MKFRYKKIRKGIFRPVIPVKIIKGIRSLTTEALLDTGADFCIFNSEISDYLGIKLSTGRRAQVSGISGDPLGIYFHRVKLEIDGFEYSCEVAFSAQVGELSHGILGQVGLFDKFVATFDYHKKNIELRVR